MVEMIAKCSGGRRQGWGFPMTSVPTGWVIVLCIALIAPPAYADSSGESPGDQTDRVKGAQRQEVTPGNGSASGAYRIDLDYLKGYFVDTGKIVISPLSFGKEEWIKLGLVLGVTSSMFLIDERVQRFALKNQSTVAGRVAQVGNDLGNPLYTLPPVGAFYLYGALANDSKARRASLIALESYTVSAAMTSGLKILADRHRPNTGDGPTTWDGPRLSLRNLSFSSAHTAAAFSIATVFAGVYEDTACVAPLAYGLATLTGLSRIYSNEHWSSDVFFGAAIGYFTSKALLNYHKEDTNKIVTGITILPEIGTKMNGVTVAFGF